LIVNDIRPTIWRSEVRATPMSAGLEV